MDIFRRLVVIFGAVLLFVFIFATVTMFSISLTFNQPDNLKSWMHQENAYQTISQTVTDNIINRGVPDSNITFEAPEARMALEQTISEEYVQQSAEKVIDETYEWLRRESDNPGRIDLDETKAMFADNLEEYTRLRMMELPPCGPLNLPQTDNPLEINCRPPQELIDEGAERMQQQVIDSDLFDSQDQLTLDNTADLLEEPHNAQTLDETEQDIDHLPVAYWRMNVAPWVLLGLTILLSTAILFAARSRRGGIRAILITTLACGLLITMAGGLMLFIFDGISGSLTPNMQTAPIQTLVAGLARQAAAHVSNIQLWAGTGLVIASLVGLVVIRVTKNNNRRKNNAGLVE